MLLATPAFYIGTTRGHCCTYSVTVMLTNRWIDRRDWLYDLGTVFVRIDSGRQLLGSGAYASLELEIMGTTCAGFKINQLGRVLL